MRKSLLLACLLCLFLLSLTGCGGSSESKTLLTITNNTSEAFLNAEWWDEATSASIYFGPIAVGQSVTKEVPPGTSYVCFQKSSDNKWYCIVGAVTIGAGQHVTVAINNSTPIVLD